MKAHNKEMNGKMLTEITVLIQYITHSKVITSNNTICRHASSIKPVIILCMCIITSKVHPTILEEKKIEISANQKQDSSSLTETVFIQSRMCSRITLNA